MNSAPEYDAYGKEWGPGLIGYIFTLWMSGLTVGQLTFYLKAFVNDRRCTKVVVIFVFVLDMFHTCCISALLWQLVVNCRHNTSPQCAILPWEMLTGIFLNSMISVIVQCFYAYRVWIISDKNWKLTGSVLVIALGQYGIGIATMVTTAAAFFTSPLDVPYAAASVICDVMISGSCLFYLRPGRAGVERPSNHMQHLIVVSLQMGVFTSLNARKSMRNQLKEHVPVVPTIPMIVVSEP
ncbi:hypothetical protein F4604DRAFT_50887 [Suillus subluteus]|nr:hypothetical protein F4604DRAFT_50887 [Suillus subluteus]